MPSAGESSLSFAVWSRMATSGVIPEHRRHTHCLRRVIRKDGLEVPDARLVRGESQQDTGLRATLLSESRTRRRAEVAARDVGAKRGHVALDELGLAPNLDSSERRDRLEHEEAATRVAPEVAELDVAGR